MRTNAISTASLWNTPRTGVARMQSEIASANKELVTGRHADMGLTLGSRTGVALSLRQTSAELTALRDGNDITGLRLSSTQTILQQIQADTDTALAAITGAPPDQRARVIADTAASRLASLTAALNTTAGGQSIFGGTNTLETPMKAYGGTAKAAVDLAFTSTFGARGSAGLATATGAQMAAFLAPGGAFDALFDDASWGANWSAASDGTIQSRISRNETVETSTSANAAAFRDLAKAHVLASDLDLSHFSAEVQDVMAGRIAGLLGSASASLVTLQANLGRSQAAIADANGRLEAQQTLLAKQIRDMESVDTAEAKTRIDQLTTQVQISYSLTSELRQLSLVNYL
ncbi:hypothetical protein ASG40_02870 [Methylobacterium sp. Leaf399]|uniref:flagellar hook-associated family protein n=1 Tax=unclassified Methylobacterium TaxID=2615210 RepID=UPI0006FEC135|nr:MULTISPECIES: flagellar hook-associated family protein [unclassified Methylobacterium]KQP61627.1 hypothetical protein ASF39_02860 [Methylobacterium sp. Leaf108]KQT19777.1 hypothetical protein ASG40_02870 [Methylobacterium sp. Leaf399]KQT80827.1 hypothetical protein ASG59_05295 [Methylobacterium sp. Leaf466]